MLVLLDDGSWYESVPNHPNLFEELDMLNGGRVTNWERLEKMGISSCVGYRWDNE